MSYLPSLTHYGIMNNPFVEIGFETPHDAFINNITRLMNLCDEMGITGNTVKDSLSLAIEGNINLLSFLNDIDSGIIDLLTLTPHG